MAGHSPIDWFARGVWPSCSCGFAPRDNAALNEHWRQHGIAWVDVHGALTKRTIRPNSGQGRN